MANPKIPAYLKLETGSHHHTKADLKKMDAIEKQLRGSNDLIDSAPETLSELGKHYYYFIVSELSERDILSNLDIPLIEQTADCLDKMQIADNLLNEEGMFIDAIDSKGNRFKKEHPAVATKQKYLNQFRFCTGQLGMSPSSRAQMAQSKHEAKIEAEKPLSKVLDRRKN